jgi:hypothetical protein
MAQQITIDVSLEQAADKDADKDVETTVEQEQSAENADTQTLAERAESLAEEAEELAEAAKNADAETLSDEELARLERAANRAEKASEDVRKDSGIKSEIQARFDAGDEVFNGVKLVEGSRRYVADKEGAEELFEEVEPDQTEAMKWSASKLAEVIKESEKNIDSDHFNGESTYTYLRGDLQEDDE